jgi:hypothetical protein
MLVAYGEAVDPPGRPQWSDEECVAAVRAGILALRARYGNHPLLAG